MLLNEGRKQELLHFRPFGRVEFCDLPARVSDLALAITIFHAWANTAEYGGEVGVDVCHAIRHPCLTAATPRRGEARLGRVVRLPT